MKHTGQHVSIGIDIGTTTICGIVVDIENGEVLRSDTLPNDTAYQGDKPFERLQDCERIVENVKALVKTYRESYEKICSIGVTGQMHGILYIDKEGRALSPLYTWQDESGNQMMEGTDEETTYAEAFREMTGYQGATGYGMVTLFCHSRQGLLPKGAVKVCTIGDYVAMCLAGRTDPIVHGSNGASLGGFSIGAGAFDEEALRRAGIPVELIPHTVNGFDVVGTLEGIPVAVSIGDNQASFIGSVKGADAVLINVGTGGQVSRMTGASPVSKVMEMEAASENLEIRPLYDTRNLVAGSSLCGGRAYAALADFFKQCGTLLFDVEKDSVYEEMGRLAKETWEKKQEDALAVSTLFCGTRTQPNLRGSVGNIGLTNFTPGALILGTLEGMADELYGMYAKMEPFSGNGVQAVIGSGNGIRRNEMLQKILEEKFESKVLIPSHQEEAAFGSVLYSLVACNEYETLELAQERMVHYI